MAASARMLPLLIVGIALVLSPPAGNAQTAALTLAQERAAAKAAGLELSAAALSPPMPPPSENAALIYEKLIEMSRPKTAAELMRNFNEPKPTPEQRDEQMLEAVSRRPDQVSDADWLKVRKILEHRVPELNMVRDAARRSKCVFGPNELAGEPGSEFEMNVAMPAAAEMREAARLLLYESIWEAHDRRPNDAVRDLSLDFRIARQAAAKQGLTGYFNAESISGVALGGFKAVIRMYATDSAVCRKVREIIKANWQPIPLSETLKVEAAISQGMLEAISKAGPQIIRESKKHQTLADFNQKIDAYSAYQLRGMRREIAVVDAPYSQSAPKLRAIYDEVAAKPSGSDDFPNTFINFADMPFHRDSFANAVAVTDAGAAVMIYHTENGKFPTTLSDAMPKPPTDAFDGKPLHYEVTEKGFVISATHQRPGHAPEQATFRYPLSASNITR